jgi:hypothetical protein
MVVLKVGGDDCMTCAPPATAPAAAASARRHPVRLVYTGYTPAVHVVRGGRSPVP